MPSQNPHPRTLIGWEAIAPKLLSIVNQEQNLHRMSNRWSKSTSENIASAKQAIDSSSHAARSFFEYLEFCRPTWPLQISLITSYLAFSISVSLCFYFVNSTAQKMISVFTTALSLSLSLSVGFLSMNTLAPPSHSPSSRVIANPMTLSSTLLFCFLKKKPYLMCTLCSRPSWMSALQLKLSALRRMSCSSSSSSSSSSSRPLLSRLSLLCHCSHHHNASCQN